MAGGGGGGILGVNGPLYMKRDGALVSMGFRVDPRHCNPMGILHGGMMASFCGMLPPLVTHCLVPEIAWGFLPTISLHLYDPAPTPRRLFDVDLGTAGLTVLRAPDRCE